MCCELKKVFPKRTFLSLALMVGMGVGAMGEQLDAPPPTNVSASSPTAPAGGVTQPK